MSNKGKKVAGGKLAEKHLEEAIKAYPYEPKDGWWNYANCKGLAPKFPEDGSAKNKFFVQRGASSREGMAICSDCQVRLDCAYDHMGEKFGTWGGMNERPRRRLRHYVLEQGGTVVYPKNIYGDALRGKAN